MVTIATAGNNPFANKSVAAQNRNPFNKPLHKSDTFFDKVEAAEINGRPAKATASGSGKSKALVNNNGRKDVGPRQTTLFGLPSASSEKPEKRGRQKRTDTSATLGPATQPAVESQVSQTVTLTDSGATESQQTILDSQQEPNASVDDGSPEPIDWPASPPAASAGLPEVDVGA